MERKILLTAVVLAAFVLGPMAMAQSASPQVDSKKATELVARSENQKAEPAPATQATPQQTPQTETPATAVGQAQDSGQQQAAAAKTFTGTIMKANDVFVLKTSDNMTYQLDDQARAKEYEGKQVQVTGSLDSGSNTIKVQDIKQA
jgi:Ni/Co efflux regulator RcnB